MNTQRPEKHSTKERGTAFVEYLVLVSASIFLLGCALPTFVGAMSGALTRAELKLKYAETAVYYGTLEAGGGTRGTTGEPPPEE